MADETGAGPDPALLARWLLAAEAGAGTSPEELAAAGERVYLRLRTRMAVLLGMRGFDALWARASSRAQQALRAGDGPTPEDAMRTDAYGLHIAVHGRAPAAVEQALVAAFASFITLLFTFIGAELGSHFLRQIWPNFPPAAAGPDAEETTP